MREFDVVVVGAGVMGAATAWEVARAGRRVAVLERFEVGHDRGSSHGRARVFRLSYPDPAYVRMAAEALPLWRDIEDESGVEILGTTGALDTGPWELLRANAEAFRACGVPHQILSGSAAMDRFPMFRLDPEGTALFQPDAGITAADRAVRAFVDAAVSRGAELSEGTTVVNLVPDGPGVEVVTEDGTLRARAAVIAAGPWAGPLAAGAGVDLPVVPSRETVAFYRFEARNHVPVLVEWSDHPLYALPSPGEGLKSGWHHSGPDADPEHPGGVETAVVERMAAWVGERYVGVDPQPYRAETCLYTNTRDERFILERHGPIVVGSACSGHGFKFAPLIGRKLAALALA